MNLALINGEIDFYCTGGTYTASPARLDGATNIRGITPKQGPDGRQGRHRLGRGHLGGQQPAGLAPGATTSSHYVQEPEVCHAVAFAEGTYNPVTQMANPKVFEKFSSDELDAIQWDSLEQELANSCRLSDQSGLRPSWTRSTTRPSARLNAELERTAPRSRRFSRVRPGAARSRIMSRN